MSRKAFTQVKQILKTQSVSSFEMIPLNRPLSFTHYEQWLRDGHHGEMTYMSANQKVRENPSDHFPHMKSIIVFEQDYFKKSQNQDLPVFPGLKVARYARHTDYHFWFRDKLNQLIEKLKQNFPNESFMAFTDSVPLLERDYAAQAGLGWTGKNTCTIHPQKGSFFFIGEILTSLECSERPTPLHDFCGSCTACMDHCPTDAFIEPRKLNATRCLSYWNIESKKTPPPEIRKKMQDWFFGCDICQEVCPWNIKIHKLGKKAQEKNSLKDQQADLHLILTSSNKKLLKIVKETPLSRAGARGLKRNALIVIGNLKLKNLKQEVTAYLDHPQLGELAQWTMVQLNS